MSGQTGGEAAAPLTVVLVDDMSINNVLLQRRLERILPKGTRYHACTTYDQARTLLASVHPPDLVCLDHHLGTDEPTGTELGAWFRTLPGGPAACLVGVTSMSDDTAHVAWAMESQDAVFGKPIRESDLDRLQELLAERSYTTACNDDIGSV